MDNGTESYRRFRENGDESGLVDIIKEYKDGLIFYLNSIVNDIYTAEDLAEDTFFLLFTKRPPDKRRGSFKTWLYTIGRNVAIDHMRRRVGKQEVSFDVCDNLSEDEENLEFSFIKNERKISVHRALNKLKPEYRQVLWLTYFDEFSNRETAMIMKKSVHNVESLVSRARKALKEELEAEGFDHNDI